MEEQMNLFEFAVEDVSPKAEPKTALTPRQWALYRLIKQNTEQGRKTTQREICVVVEGYEWNEKDGNTHDHCVSIWNDLNGAKGLNFSPEIQKIVITENFEYWIGDREEVADYLNSLWKELMPRLIRYWKLKAKQKEDGQGQIFSCHGELIDDDSAARGYIEAFLEHPKFD